MFNYAWSEKREKKVKAHWESEITSLKAHEAKLIVNVTEKEAEITASTEKAVTELHEATKEAILVQLIKRVKQRNNCELKLIKWY